MYHPIRLPSLEPMDEQWWLAGRLLGRQLVDVSSVETVGRVADLVFDPQSGETKALAVEPVTQTQSLAATIAHAISRRHDVALIGLEHIIALDGDAVMVNANPFQLTVPRGLERMPRLSGTRELAVLTMRGVCLGSLADLLLDRRGVSILAYVINPTKQGEVVLPPLPQQAQEPQPGATPPSGASAASGADSTASSASSSRMRIIPVSSRVRISDSLILLVANAEPLQREEVVIVSHTSEEQINLGGA